MKNKKLIIALWVITFAFITASIPTLFYYGYSFGAIVLIVLGISALHFFLLHVVDSDWNDYDFIEQRCSMRGESPNYIINDEFYYGPKVLGSKRALREEKLNKALRIKHQKIMLHHHGKSTFYPSLYRHPGTSRGYFLFSEFGIKISKEIELRFYKELNRLKCSTYALKTLYATTNRLPTPSEDECIIEMGFDKWFLKNYMKFKGQENDNKIDELVLRIKEINKSINPKYKANV